MELHTYAASTITQSVYCDATPKLSCEDGGSGPRGRLAPDASVMRRRAVRSLVTCLLLQSPAQVLIRESLSGCLPSCGAACHEKAMRELCTCSDRLVCGLPRQLIRVRPCKSPCGLADCMA